MVAVILQPLFQFYKRKGFSRSLSMIFMIMTVIGGGYAIFLLVRFSFTIVQANISAGVEQVNSTVQQSSLFSTINKQAAQDMITPDAVLGVINKVVANFSNLFLYMIIIPILSILLIYQIDTLSESFKEQISGKTVTKLKKFSESVIAYIIGRFKVNVVTAVLIIPALVIMGIDYALLWGLLTVILSFIPYIGIFLAGAGPFLLALANGGVTWGIILIIVYLVVNAFAENILDPLVQGRQNRLSTTSLIIGLIFWSWLFGAFGTIIAAPLTVMLKTIFEDYEETKWIALLMVGDYSHTPKSSQPVKKMFNKIRNKIRL